MRKIIYYYALLTCGALLCVALPASVFAQTNAAGVYITPPTAIYPIGEPFTVAVRVDTAGTEVGTVDMTVAYEPDDLTFSSFSSEGSVFSRILVDDTRIPGKVDVSGFIERDRPAYVGDDGLVVQLTFLPKRNVATQVRFSEASATPPLTLTASVGDLTNVLSSLAAATYTLVPKEVVPPQQVVAQAVGAVEGGATRDGEFSYVPEAVEGWHATTTLKARFGLPQSATAMRTGVSTTSDAAPDEFYAVPVSSVTLDDLSEGKQYFLRQYQVGGAWNDVIAEPLNVDTTPPEITISEKAPDGTPLSGSVFIEAIDSHAGVKAYQVGVDGGELVEWERPESGIYRATDLRPGEHVITVAALDVAGNVRQQDHTLLVRSIEAPVLTQVPERVLTGDTITIRGETYPNARVTVFVSYNEADPQEYVVESTDAGTFSATISEGAKKGKYTMWFKVVDEDGAESPLSIKRSIEVAQPYIVLFGGVALTYLSVIVPLVALICILVLIIWLSLTYVRSYRRRVRRETNEAFSVVRHEFEELRDDLRKQIGVLERANQSRQLTREEMRIFNDLSKRLDVIEARIAQEVDDIEEVEEEGHVSQQVSHQTIKTYEPTTTPERQKVRFVKKQADGQQLVEPTKHGHSVRISRAG